MDVPHATGTADYSADEIIAEAATQQQTWAPATHVRHCAPRLLCAPINCLLGTHPQAIANITSSIN